MSIHPSQDINFTKIKQIKAIAVIWDKRHKDKFQVKQNQDNLSDSCVLQSNLKDDIDTANLISVGEFCQVSQ